MVLRIRCKCSTVESLAIPINSLADLYLNRDEDKSIMSRTVLSDARNCAGIRKCRLLRIGHVKMSATVNAVDMLLQKFTRSWYSPFNRHDIVVGNFCRSASIGSHGKLFTVRLARTRS